MVKCQIRHVLIGSILNQSIFSLVRIEMMFFVCSSMPQGSIEDVAGYGRKNKTNLVSFVSFYCFIRNVFIFVGVIPSNPHASNNNGTTSNVLALFSLFSDNVII